MKFRILILVSDSHRLRMPNNVIIIDPAHCSSSFFALTTSWVISIKVPNRSFVLLKAITIEFLPNWHLASEFSKMPKTANFSHVMR